MIKLNEVGLPQLIDLVPPLDQLNLRQKTNKRLETLLAVMQSQSDAIAANIDLLYQSWFIETCDDWTVSYIAKLIGLPSDLADASSIARQRALVANTLLYRSYRGTAHALSCAIQDASGWPVMVVEGIEKQLTSVQADIPPEDQPTIFTVDGGEGGAPPPSPHSTDRTIYSIYKTPITPPTSRDAVAIYYWRDQVIERAGIEAAPVGDNVFYFDPAARPLPLMIPLWGLGDTAGDLPAQLPVPTALTQLKLSEMLELANSPLEKLLRIFVNGTAIPHSRIYASDLLKKITKKETTALQKAAKAGTLALVDPELGAVKVFCGPEENQTHPPKIHSDHWATANGDMGGGIYDRSSRMIISDAATWSVLISKAATEKTEPPKGFDAVYPDLEHALEAWHKNKHAETVIHLADNNRHALPNGSLTIGDDINIVAIQAAQGFQPTLTGDMNLQGAAHAEVWISGCYLIGNFSITGGLNVILVDCTLWPPQENAISYQPDSQGASPTRHSRVDLDHCLSGPLKLSGRDCVLSVSDSIIDGMGGPALSGPEDIILDELGEVSHLPIGSAVAASNTSFFGDVYTLQLLSTTNTLVVGKIETPRHKKQTPFDGVWVSENHLPQIDIVSRQSGMPGYGVLGVYNPIELLEGASGGSEFGAWHSSFNAARLKAAQKITNHYCPIGMTAELIDTGVMPAKR